MTTTDWFFVTPFVGLIVRILAPSACQRKRNQLYFSWPPPDPHVYNPRMKKPNKGRKVALVAGLALVVLSVAMVWTYWGEMRFFLS